MTVAAQTPSASYTANGSTFVFALAAKVLTATDLKVYINSVLQTGGYSVSGVGDAGGVTVSFASPPASGAVVTLKRELPIDRTTDYPFGGTLSSDVLDLDQDRQTMILQQIADEVGRSITLPPGSTASAELPPAESNQVIGWNASGTALENKSPSSVGVVIAGDVGFTPSGSISATNVQAAIEEVAAEAGAAAPLAISIKAAPYNAVGDGTTDDSAAFTAAEASAVKVFYLPAGNYKVNGVTLTKRYYGEGRLFLDGEYYGQEYSSITSGPSSIDAANYGIDGDISHVQVSSHSLSSAARNGLSAFYFNAPTTPFFGRFANYAGNSGIDATLMANVSVGASSVVVNSVPVGLVNGVQFGLTTGANPGSVAETKTVTNVAGNTITFSPVTTNSYVVGDKIAVNIRTMNQHHFSEVNHYGGGDAYCWTGRIAVWGTTNRQPGQKHYFATSTGGVIGGDLYGGAAGVYLTGTEFNLLDTTYLGSSDISAIGQVWSFNRTADARSAISTTLSAGASVGATSISVTSATGFLSSGGTVTITGATGVDTIPVSSVSGTTVNLISSLQHAYSGGASVIYQAQAYRTTLSSGASAGASSIVVANNTGIIAGQSVLTITDGVLYSINTVANVAGTTITLGNTLGATFLAGAVVSIQNETINPYGNTWLGAIYKSEASKSGDAVISAAGKWKSGINLTMADFSAFGQSAVQMKSGQRVYFNSYYAADVAGVALWGNVLGDTYMQHSPIQGTLQTFVGNALVAEASPTAYFFRKPAECVGGVNMPTNAAIWFGGIGSSNYLYHNGSYLYYRAGGVDAIAIDSTNTYISNKPNLNGITNFFNATVSTSATAGGALALPATPYTYLTISINGTNYKVPVYNV